MSYYKWIWEKEIIVWRRRIMWRFFLCLFWKNASFFFWVKYMENVRNWSWVSDIWYYFMNGRMWMEVKERIFWNILVLRLEKVNYDIWKCCGRYLTWMCIRGAPTMYQNALRCTEDAQNAPKCTRMQRGCLKCTRMQRGCLKFTKVHRVAPKMHQNAPMRSFGAFQPCKQSQYPLKYPQLT